MTKDTRVDLVGEIMAALPTMDKSKAGTVQIVIDKAIAGEYHDYQSPFAVPKLTCVTDLEKLELYDLAKRVKQGEFDEEPDKDDTLIIRNTFPKEERHDSIN
jgi:hypothetical protein